MNTQILLDCSKAMGKTPSEFILSQNSWGCNQIKTNVGLTVTDMNMGKDKLLALVAKELLSKNSPLLSSYVNKLVTNIEGLNTNFPLIAIQTILKDVWELAKYDLVDHEKHFFKSLIIYVNSKSRTSNGRRMTINSVYTYIVDSIAL